MPESSATRRGISAISAAVLLIFSGILSPAHGQESRWRFGAGGMVGRTSGLTIKQYLNPEGAQDYFPTRRALDLTVTSNVDDFFLGSLHVTVEEAIPRSQLHVVMGPGVIFGVRDDHLFAGLSASIGVHFPKGPYEVFLQLTPRLRAWPEIDGEVGASAGMRYFF